VKRRGAPLTIAATRIDWPSGAHAGVPCSSSERATMCAFVPSAFTTYSDVSRPRRVENPMRRPSRAMDGAPMILVSCALHSSVAVSPCSFQILSLSPFDET
jgi:hypothetical protein